MKKVANIVFNPFTNDSRVLKESLSFADNGYNVEVIAHGDKDLPKIEQKEGFKVVRLSYLDRKVTKSKFKKLKIYLQWIKEVVNYTKDFDILHCNDLNALPIGVIIKKFYNKNVKIVYDAHEYETEINGLSGIQKTLTKILEKFLIRYANKVLTVSEAIADEYKKIYPFIEKPALVLNTPPYKEIAKKDIFREKFNIDKETTIFLYQGGLSSGRGIEILLDTFKQLSTVPITNNKYTNTQITNNQYTNTPVIVFMGYG
jgi:glycosyltransferase involved in cell wall biosynthesis